MKKILCALLLISALPVLAQQPDSTRGEQIFTDYINAMMNERFVFDNPDPGFSLLDDSSGFQNAEQKATIKFIVLPGGYEEVLKDFRKSKQNANRIPLDSTAFSQPRTGFTVIEEMTAPAEENSENFIAVMTVFPFTKNVAVAVIGAYPKSLDRLYRSEFVAAAMTLKHSGRISK